MGQFIEEHRTRSGKPLFGGAAVDRRRSRIARRRSPSILPYLRGVASSNRRVIAHYDGSEDALTFANSAWAEDLCRMGTSCPDHFLRTRISPMFIPWNPATRGSGAGRAAHRASARSSTGRTTRRTTRRAPTRLAGAARREPVGGRGARARAVRVRQGQARGAHHVGVLRQRHPRDGGRQRARGRGRPGRHAAAGPASRAGAGLQELPQLRRAAAHRGVPDRVLGARGSQAPAHAAGEGVQPQGRRRRRGRERHRPRGRAADRARAADTS